MPSGHPPPSLGGHQPIFTFDPSAGCRIGIKTFFLTTTRSEEPRINYLTSGGFRILIRTGQEEEGITYIGMNIYRGLPLTECLSCMDISQARRFTKLVGTAAEIATEGIIRHLAACDRMDVNPDISAIREIIDDALNGRRIYAEAV
jgi:hypothetical protein